MMKNFINKILDVPKLIRRIWLLLWVLLIILLVMKFCFGIWYPVVSNNEIFISVCNFVDNNKWLEYTIMLLFYILNSFMMIFIMTKTKKINKWYLYLLFLVLFIGMFFLKSIHNSIGIICELAIIIFSIIYNCKTNKFYNNIINILLPIIFYLIINIWQLSIYLVRGLEINELNNYLVLIPYILQLDYYIFLIITWIGVCFMGLYGWGWLWSKDITVLKSYKEKELAKAKPDMKLVSKIDARITKLEKEGK